MTDIRPCIVRGCPRDSDAVLNRADLFPGSLPRFYNVCPAHYQRMVAADDWSEKSETVRGPGREVRTVREVVFDDGTDGLGSGGFAAL